MTDVSGIYKITNIKNGKFYIGSSQEIDRRFYLHKWELRGNKHHSVTLQRSWNKYGEESFKFEIIELCAVESLLILEQKYLDEMTPYKSDIGFNISPTANGTRGVKKTEEQKLAMSVARKGKSIFKNNPVAMANKMASVLRGEKHHQYGKKLSAEHIKILSESRKGKPAWNKGGTSKSKGIKKTEEQKQKMSFTKNSRMDCNKSCKLKKEQVLEIKELLQANELMQKEIAKMYGVDPTTISYIKTNKRWNNMVC